MKDKLNIILTHNFGGSGAHHIQVPTGLFMVQMLIIGNFAWSKYFSNDYIANTSPPNNIVVCNIGSISSHL